MPNKNAQVIVPLAVGFWLLAIIVFEGGAPDVIQGLLVAAFAIAVPGVVFYLIADTGWSPLAGTYRVTVPFSGQWKKAATVHMSRVGVQHPDYERSKMRFIFSLSVGTSDDSLYLSTWLSRVPILGRLFPALQIPWTGVRRASTYRARGWVQPALEAGQLVQTAYDPNYTGTFVELEVGAPPVFLQLPLQILGDSASRLTLSTLG